MISETLGRLQKVYHEIERDLKQARKSQESLFPELTRGFGGAQVSPILKPCGNIGGDLVGMFSLWSGSIGFYSIDVSGHGITSAMMTARLGGYLNTSHFSKSVAVEKQFGHAFALRPPEDVAHILNDWLMADTGVEERFTMVYGTLDMTSGNLRMVQAGHPHPLAMRQSGEIEFIGEGGLPIGLLPDVTYEAFDTTLAPGDRILALFRWVHRGPACQWRDVGL